MFVSADHEYKVCVGSLFYLKLMFMLNLQFIFTNIEYNAIIIYK